VILLEVYVVSIAIAKFEGDAPRRANLRAAGAMTILKSKGRMYPFWPRGPRIDPRPLLFADITHLEASGFC